MMQAFYDLSTSPPTYDIVAFLCAVERIRQDRGEDHVNISIVHGPKDGFRNDRLWPFSTEERVAMLERVAIPMAVMLPNSTVSVEDVPRHLPADSVGFGKRLYGTGEQVRSMEIAGRPLRPSSDLSKSDRLVTITLREAEHWPARNSNVIEWCDASGKIAAMGFDVVIIRDTFRVNSVLPRRLSPGVMADYEAPTNLDRRAQLYRSARANLFVSCGPAWFALALDSPATILRPICPISGRTASAAHFARSGIPFGGQIPGSPSYQRLVWRGDGCDSIVAAFEESLRA